ncbi:MAG TPA: RDD family protein [Thermoanaerobaculia bacterium]|nr:RDD family protein [Thermoanaerobaculia bacterium]
MRFDEMELQGMEVIEAAVVESPSRPAAERRLFKHTLALLIDLSLFAALSLALSPLLPQTSGTLARIALGAFVLMLSFYYFVGAWTLWGKTIGAAIFDVRVEKRTLRAASLRWLWLVIGVAVVSVAVTAAMP